MARNTRCQASQCQFELQCAMASPGLESGFTLDGCDTDILSVDSPINSSIVCTCKRLGFAAVIRFRCHQPLGMQARQSGSAGHAVCRQCTPGSAGVLVAINYDRAAASVLLTRHPCLPSGTHPLVSSQSIGTVYLCEGGWSSNCCGWSLGWSATSS